MPADARLVVLRQRWEAARRRGQTLSATELCRDCPELRDVVRQQLELWQLDTGPAGVSFGVALDDTGQAGAAARAAAPLQLAAGAEPIPGYRLVRALGRGGFGEVWEAVGPGGFPAALKFVRLAEKAAAAEQRALDVMKRLRHPNLLALHGTWQYGHYLMLAMELADGTLLDRLRQAVAQGQPGIPRPELLPYLRQAADGLDYLNGQGVQHRDVKPHNLLVVGGAVKVGDFGLAKLLHATVASASGSMTASYASPEACNDQLSRWSDQYSLAVTYCQLRGNQLPFEGPLAAVVAGHMMGKPHLDMVPAAERAAVARALAKQPTERWESCAAFVAALAASDARRALLAAPTVPVGRPANPPAPPAGRVAGRAKGRPAPKPAPPRSPWPVVATCVGLLASVLLLIVLVQLAGRDDAKPAVPDPWANRKEPKAAVDSKVRDPELIPKSIDKTPKDKDEPKPKVDDEPEQKKLDKESQKKPAPPVLAQEITNSLGMKLVLIPRGTFRMGSPPGEEGRSDDEHEHEVAITQPFYLGKFEVTKGQFAEFVKATGYRTDAEKDGKGGYGLEGDGQWNQRPEYTWRNTGWAQDDRHPVGNVSWNDAVAFCAWLSTKEGKKYRLPTEAEWEYSCRAGTTTRYYSGEDPESLATVGNVADASASRKFPNWSRTIKADDGYVFTAPVGQFKANPFGLHDMHGNVWEWCQDWYDGDYYQTSPREDPQGPDAGVYRVIRGGSFGRESRVGRAAYRSNNAPSDRSDSLGFRVVLVR